MLLKRERNSDRICVRLGDWSGVVFDPHAVPPPLAGQVDTFMASLLRPANSLLRVVGIPQVQLYFDQQQQLVDVRTSLNKFLGPGMLADIFGKIFSVPATRKVETLDQRAMEAIAAGTGSYSGSIILKPSRYRWMESPTGPVPLYVAVRR